MGAVLRIYASASAYARKQTAEAARPESIWCENARRESTWRGNTYALREGFAKRSEQQVFRRAGNREILPLGGEGDDEGEHSDPSEVHEEAEH